MSKNRTDKKATKTSNAEGKQEPAQPLSIMIAGDNRGARALARQVLANPTTPNSDRLVLSDLLTRTNLDRAALAASLAMVSVLTVILVLLYR